MQRCCTAAKLRGRTDPPLFRSISSPAGVSLPLPKRPAGGPPWGQSTVLKWFVPSRSRTLIFFHFGGAGACVVFCSSDWCKIKAGPLAPHELSVTNHNYRIRVFG